MRRLTILGMVMVLAMALAACAPAVTATDAPAVASTISAPVTGETPTAIGPAAGASTETTGGVDAAGTTTAEAALATSTSETGASAGTGITTDAAIRISTSTSPSVREPFLVDQQGRALYLFSTDSQNGGSSACSGDCLTQWPPLIVTGTPQAGQGVDASLLGTITRQDGTLQATYHGWPLYFYVGDTGPGNTSGQGMAGVWFLVSGAGNSIPQ